MKNIILTLLKIIRFGVCAKDMVEQAEEKQVTKVAADAVIVRPKKEGGHEIMLITRLKKVF